MKPADYEGKSVREIEKQISNGKGVLGWRVRIVHILLALLFILLGYGGASLILHNEIDRLVADNTTMKIKNGVLKEDNASLKKQLNDNQRVNQPISVIYHDVKKNDTLGSICVRYYGTGSYASHLAKLNGLTVKTTLQVGQIIKVPKEPDASWKKNGEN
ncbi:LysM peptidoglycan-binding domain-containing protein [Desulfoscipio sp. XC116]|uniref:LysM peptidoglycan-binding domain-containing protein n=1 Tax=Desulfoscipio sp. XC116 TaxID=3144975 RepID=UPI00325B2C20